MVLDGLASPEGPRWHGDRLWFAHFADRTVNRLGPDGKREVVIQTEDRPSGIGFLPDDTPIVVATGTCRLLRLVAGGTEVHAELAGMGGDYLNDMITDGDGNAYVGTRTWALRPSRSPLPARCEIDSLVLVHPDGKAQVAAEHLISPNGMAVSPDGSFLVVAETYGQRLTRFDRAPDGSLSNRRVFAELPGAYPDGICLDEEGAVWVASPYTSEFLRVRDGGEVSDRLSLPGGVACVFGGEDRGTLFLLGTDPAGLPVPDSAAPLPQRSADEPLTGGHIWTLAVPHGGAGWP